MRSESEDKRMEKAVETRISPLKSRQVVDFPDIESVFDNSAGRCFSAKGRMVPHAGREFESKADRKRPEIHPLDRASRKRHFSSQLFGIYLGEDEDLMNQLHNQFESLQKFDLGNGRQGHFYSLPALEKAGVGADFAAAGFHPARAGSGAAQLRRQKGDGEKRPRTRPTGSPRRRARRKFRSSWRGLCCRISRACRCWWTWRRCARRWRGWARTRRSSSRWCRWIWWWTIRCRWISRAARTRCGGTWRSNSSATASVTSF